MDNIKILAISGSLRAKSSNTSVLKASQILAGTAAEITLYSELAQLPHFNPDLDREPLPEIVISLRQHIKRSNGIIISSPEYAHGVPGTLKNALDWLVSSIEFPGKPVMLINTNPRATIAFISLQEILNTMSASINSLNNVTLAIAGKRLDAKDIVQDSELATLLTQRISNFIEEIKQ